MNVGVLAIPKVVRKRGTKASLVSTTVPTTVPTNQFVYPVQPILPNQPYQQLSVTQPIITYLQSNPTQTNVVPNRGQVPVFTTPLPISATPATIPPTFTIPPLNQQQPVITGTVTSTSTTRPTTNIPTVLPNQPQYQAPPNNNENPYQTVLQHIDFSPISTEGQNVIEVPFYEQSAPAQQSQILGLIQGNLNTMPIIPPTNNLTQLTGQSQSPMVSLPHFNTPTGIPNIITSSGIVIPNPSSTNLNLPTVQPVSASAPISPRGRSLERSVGTPREMSPPRVAISPSRQKYQRCSSPPTSPRSLSLSRSSTPPSPPGVHQCCICIEGQVSESSLLSCKHPVCGTCLTQLPTTKCPLCRAPLTGPTVTKSLLESIKKREAVKEDETRRTNAIKDEVIRRVTALWIRFNPNQIMYQDDIARRVSDAVYNLELSTLENPEMRYSLALELSHQLISLNTSVNQELLVNAIYNDLSSISV